MLSIKTKAPSLKDPLLKKGLDQRGEKVLKVREGSSGVYVVRRFQRRSDVLLIVWVIGKPV